jgi:hypothetical protein
MDRVLPTVAGKLASMAVVEPFEPWRQQSGIRLEDWPLRRYSARMGWLSRRSTRRGVAKINEKTNRYLSQFEQLTWSPDAYRPGLLIRRSDTPLQVRFELLGDLAGQLHISTGYGFLVLAVETLAAIDRFQDYDVASEDVLRRAFVTHTLMAMNELSISQFTDGADGGTFVDITAIVFRAEAWREAVAATGRRPEEIEDMLADGRRRLASMGVERLL